MKNVQSRTWRKILKGWLIHMEIARPHNSGRAQRCIEASRAEHPPHPEQNPDLTSSNLFLFGYIKRKRSDYGYESREDLWNATTAIFTGVDQELLLSVFESWANRLKWVITHKWKYYTE
jgi:hypothetical protein